jgi:hypothetical protein
MLQKWTDPLEHASHYPSKCLHTGTAAKRPRKVAPAVQLAAQLPAEVAAQLGAQLEGTLGSLKGRAEQAAELAAQLASLSLVVQTQLHT